MKTVDCGVVLVMPRGLAPTMVQARLVTMVAHAIRVNVRTADLDVHEDVKYKGSKLLL